MGASFIVEGQGGDNFSAIFRILKVMYFRDCPCASVQLNMTFFSRTSGQHAHSNDRSGILTNSAQK
jgi:hypothetical protein